MEHSITIGEVMHELLRLLQLRSFGITATTASVKRSGDADKQEQSDEELHEIILISII
jgi:hypothetical protein